MGDCYSVVLRDEAEAAFGRIDWGLAEARRAGVRPESFAGVCKLLLAFHQGTGIHSKDSEGYDVYSSGFNASYGWHGVMVRAFDEMSPALKEGSRLEIDCDGGRTVLETERDPDTGDMVVWEQHTGRR